MAPCSAAVRAGAWAKTRQHSPTPMAGAGFHALRSSSVESVNRSRFAANTQAMRHWWPGSSGSTSPWSPRLPKAPSGPLHRCFPAQATPLQPLLGIYPGGAKQRSTLAQALEAGERRWQGWLATIPHQAVVLPAQQLLNANTPAERARLMP